MFQAVQRVLLLENPNKQHLDLKGLRRLEAHCCHEQNLQA